MPTACSSKGSITNGAWFQLDATHVPDGNLTMMIRTTGATAYMAFGDSAPSFAGGTLGDAYYELTVNTTSQVFNANPRKLWLRSSSATNAAVNVVAWW